jgi:uncharacterized protein YkwD
VAVTGRLDSVLTRARQWLRWRPTDQVGWAVLVAGALALIGILFLVIAPLSAAAPHTDSLPASHPSPGAPSAPSVTGAPDSSAAPPGPASALPTASAKSVKTSVLEDQLRGLLNQVRDQVGCDKLREDGHLTEAARGHSQDMARKGFVGHQGSDGSSPDDRMRKAGYHKPRAEDIGSGYPSARAALDAWAADPRQRAPLADCDLKAVGIGVAADRTGVTYWTADFGG